MKLNRVEKALMNNPLRSMVQWHHEAALMEKLGGRIEGLKVLEIGCGRGIGAEIILEKFGAREVHAFDLDPRMIDLARERLSKYPAERLRLFVGDAEKIDAPDNSYDAVFDFGIIHHIPAWQDAVAEVARVLTPQGRFFFEEVTRQALNRWLYRVFLEHPTKNRFSGKEFVTELESQGITIGDNTLEWCFGDFIVGVGRKKGKEAKQTCH